MSEWTPLVYARTYSVDYRFIVKPADFDSQDARWARKYILGTFETFSAEGLDDPVRWSVFKDRYCVVGMTCMAYQLKTDKFQDEAGRRGLQVFLGYVSNRKSSALSALPPMEKRLFEPLYRLVEDHWNDQTWQQDNPQRTDYRYNLPGGNFPDTRGWRLNTEEQNTLTRPVTFNDWLWAIASGQLKEPRTFSLCLNISRQSRAQEGPFLNTSTFDFPRDVDKPIYLPKSAPPSSRYVSPGGRPSPERGRPAMPAPPPRHQPQNADQRSQPPAPGLFGSIRELFLGPDTPAEDAPRSRDAESFNRNHPRNSPPPGFTFKEQADAAPPPPPSGRREPVSRKERDAPPAGFKYAPSGESSKASAASEDILSQEKSRRTAQQDTPSGETPVEQAQPPAQQDSLPDEMAAEQAQPPAQQDTSSGEPLSEASEVQEGIKEATPEEPASND